MATVTTKTEFLMGEIRRTNEKWEKVTRPKNVQPEEKVTRKSKKKRLFVQLARSPRQWITTISVLSTNRDRITNKSTHKLYVGNSHCHRYNLFKLCDVPWSKCAVHAHECSTNDEDHDGLGSSSNVQYHHAISRQCFVQRLASICPTWNPFVC